MLSSSDAKFRCLWHMFTWSIMLTLVSQFYVLTDHIAFYIFGSLCILVLPFVTSLYSTTGGRRGSSLLRVAYVLCDPVLACMSVVPVLLLNRLTPLIHEMECLGVDIKSWNETLSCLGNRSSSNLESMILEENVPFSRKPWIWLEKKNLLTAIQGSIIIPCILALFMGRRSRKMSYTTALMSFTYWLITSIECASIIETTLLCGYTKVHFAVTTQVTVCVACILANSYAAVTLCSYLSPMTCKGDKSAVCARFDMIYKSIAGATGVVFVEIPQLVARFQMLASASDWPMDDAEFQKFVAAEQGKVVGNSSESFEDGNVAITAALELDPNDIYNSFPTSFYMWAFKDGIMIAVIISSIVLQKFGKSPPILLKILGEGKNCAGVAFDNPDTFFVPEKRDKYIITHCGKLQDPDFRDGAPKPKNYPDRMISQDSVEESCFFLPRRNNKTSLVTSIKSHKKLKKEERMEQLRNDDKTLSRTEQVSLSPIAFLGSSSLDAAVGNDSNSTNLGSHNLDDVMQPLFSGASLAEQQNADGRRKKSVKFSFSEDHIINNESIHSYPKPYPRNSYSMGSILVNSSNRNNQSCDIDLGVPPCDLPQSAPVGPPPDVLSLAADQKSAISNLYWAGDESSSSTTKLEGEHR